MTPLTELKPITAEQGTPLYVLARDAIKDAVDAGQLPPGAQLPSTKALSEQLGVSLVTVHRALQELVASGVLRRGQGRGTFVHEHYDERRDAATGTRLGIVLHGECSLADSFHGQLFEGVRQEATDRGVDLVLLRFGEDWRRECSGYLYVNPLPDQLERPPRFMTQGRASAGPQEPVVVLGARFDRPGVGWIDTDNVEIGRIAARHLAEREASSLVYLGDGSALSNSRDRWTGFTSACRSAGLPFDPSQDAIRVQDWRLNAEAEARLRDRLTSDPNVAVFAAGYYFALGAYKVAADLGLRVGEDIAVLGVDDPPSAEYLSPGLSTVAQPLIEVGRAAVREIMNVVQHSSEPSRQTLAPELIVRESTTGAVLAGGSIAGDDSD
ncbi:MAG: GntR family transcriptional regulator [Planctomycetota bacterium]